MSETMEITDGPIPKHEQLSDTLARIAAEELQPDSAIPSERTLMKEFGVSRATVRKAIERLVADGLLVRVHGKGTFVARPRLDTQLHLASFSQDMRRRGRVPSTRILGCEREQPGREISGNLQMSMDELAWRITRVRLADGQPIALEVGWYPVSLLPDLGQQDLTDSLYEVFSGHYGLSIDSAEQTLWGEISDPETSLQLGAGEPVPLLVFRRISTSGGRPVEYVISRYRGDHYEVHMSLHSSAAAGQSTEGN